MASPGGRRFGAAFESAEKENEVIRQIKVYIQDHIETKLSREDIAEAVYLSPGYMTQGCLKKKPV